MSHFLSSEFPQSGAKDALFHVIPVPLEKSVSYGTGTANGAEAILEASYQLEAFDGTSCPGDHGIHTTAPLDCSGEVSACLANIRAACTPVYEAGHIPVLLGGEHTLSLAPVEALHELRQDFGVVQIDAHADLRDSYEQSPYSHACVMRRIPELGVPVCQIGVRNLCVEEVDYRARHGIRHLDAREIFEHGIPEMILPADFPEGIRVAGSKCGLVGTMRRNAGDVPCRHSRGCSTQTAGGSP